MVDTKLKEQLVRSIFRFKKVGMNFHSNMEVNMGEVVVMNVIAMNISDPDEKICISDIHNKLYITKPAVSQILSSLEKKGYINREIDSTDRRKILVSFTKEGQEILKSMREYSSKQLSEIITRFGEEDTKKLIDLFNRFADISEELKEESLQADKK